MTVSTRTTSCWRTCKPFLFELLQGLSRLAGAIVQDDARWVGNSRDRILGHRVLIFLLPRHTFGLLRNGVFVCRKITEFR